MTVTDAPGLTALAASADRFRDTVRALADDDVRRACALPGWTRGHLLTHVARAADSRTGILRAAQAGLIGEQYPSEEARAGAIEEGARRPAAVIRADALRAVEECLTAMRQHPAGLWDAPAIWLRGGRHPVRGARPACAASWNSTTWTWPPATPRATGPPSSSPRSFAG